MTTTETAVAAEATYQPPVKLTQPQNNVTPLEAGLLIAVRDPSVPMDRVERLHQLLASERAERRKQSFMASMAEAQNKMRRVVADAQNTQTKSRYATYGQLDRAVRNIYSDAGFSVSFDTDVSPKATEAQDYVRVVAFIYHDGGHEERRHIDIPVVTKGPQGGAVMTPTHATISGVTYGKTALLKMIFNLAIGEDPDDDDGNAAGGHVAAGPISAEQVKTINDLITKSGTDLKQFLEYGGIAKVEDIVTAKFDQVVAMLNAKLRRKAVGQ
jgi:ERF superfamily